MSNAVRFAPGSLVRARDREWVVLPDLDGDLLVLRPLGGGDEDIAGVYLPLERVEPATFDLPTAAPEAMGDFVSCALLRDAALLSARSSAGPFRSFGRIAVEPRPYQLVPLLMALRQDTVRLLIADDVGIGKTIEAALIARELLDRGEIRRVGVLCPPQLAEQWQAELRDKFHLDAELVLPGTAPRLERGLPLGRTLFDVHPHVIVSADFIKSDRRRTEFARAAPELVIVDEAHTFAESQGRSGQHQRHRLLKELAARPDRHMILVTATPHSGDESAFRSLLTALNPSFADLPEDLSGRANEAARRELARYFVQRKRGDIQHYLDEETVFPERLPPQEVGYTLHPAYKAFFEAALRYAREVVTDRSGTQRQQRIRWWSMLALLRALASSPAAAVATLRNRAAAAAVASDAGAQAVDEAGRRTVLDLVDDEPTEGADQIPGSDFGKADSTSDAGVEQHDAAPVSAAPVSARRLRELARQAETLAGDQDNKLHTLVKSVRELQSDGFSPIVFCRFIETADYVAAHLRDALKHTHTAVESVTGALTPSEREARVAALGEHPRRVLVCTDCLSEGINLQQWFDAVIHYDLSWNPTRHEQREGRVDRYRQPSKAVRFVTFYGRDNQIDGIVLDVLIRKHNKIRNSLGISVPVPVDSEQIVEAIFEGLLLRGAKARAGDQLSLFSAEGILPPAQARLLERWEQDAEREKRSRTLFAQHAIKPEEVLADLREARAAVGGAADVLRFTRRALERHGAAVTERPDGVFEFNLSAAPRDLRDMVQARPDQLTLRARFTLPVAEGVTYLSRTHPFVEGLATYVLDAALDPLGRGAARRAGAMRTDAVTVRTTLLLVRFRHHLHPARGEPMLAEECALLGFTGAPEAAVWLSDPTPLLQATPAGNISPQQAADFVGKVVAGYQALRPHVEGMAHERAAALLQAHNRVRAAASGAGRRIVAAEPQLPADVLGIYVLLPALRPA